MDLVGFKLDEKTYQIESSKIKEFADALGFENSIYQDIHFAKEKGYRNIVAPPTFPMAITLWGGYGFDYICEKLRLNPKRVLHAKQSFDYYGHFVAGDVVTLSGEVKNVVKKEKIDFLDVEIKFFNEKKEHVVTSNITIAQLKKGGS